MKGSRIGRATAVRCDLLIGIAYKTDKQLLRQELRRCPIEMEVDTVSILRLGILEIVGEATNRRKFVAGQRIEVGVADTAIDRAMADAEIRQTFGIVGADRDVPGCVDHIIVDVVVPFQHRDRIEVAKTGDGAADVFAADRNKRPESGRQRSGQVGGRSADEPPMPKVNCPPRTGFAKV